MKNIMFFSDFAVVVNCPFSGMKFMCLSRTLQPNLAPVTLCLLYFISRSEKHLKLRFEGHFILFFYFCDFLLETNIPNSLGMFGSFDSNIIGEHHLHLGWGEEEIILCTTLQHSSSFRLLLFTQPLFQ